MAACLVSLLLREVLLVLSCSFSVRGCTCVISLHSRLMDPFFCRERSGSFKKGPSTISAQTFTFFLVLDPFLCFKTGPHQLRPAPFSWCWTPFSAVSGLDPPKRGPPPLQLRPSPFSWVPDPFLCRERSGSFKKGPSTTSAQTFTFFLVLDPFLCFKMGPHQLRPAPFSWCWTPFSAVSGLDPPKRGPPPLQLRPSPFSWVPDPFLCRERSGSFKKGPSATSAQTFTFFLVLDPFLCRERPGTFKKTDLANLPSNLLPDRLTGCTCVSSLCLNANPRGFFYRCFFSHLEDLRLQDDLMKSH